MADTVYQGKRFPCTQAGFTPITAPIDCNICILVNDSGVAVLRRTTSADATTQTLMDINGSIQLGLSQNPKYERWVRWNAGEIVTYVKANAGGGTGDIYADFIR